MLKAVIVDDEEKSIKTIQLILKDYCMDVDVVGTANSPDEAIKIINKTEPDIVFLDIEMPHGSGFEVLENIPDRHFDVIFITAYDQYAIKAFKYSAVDYILKPIDIDEIVGAVNRILNRGKLNGRPNYDLLIENINTSKPKKLTLPTSKGYLFIDIDNIIYFESDRNYSFIYLTNQKKILVSKNIGDFEEFLDDTVFFRCHRSYLINMYHVQQYIKTDGGEIEMINGAKIPISRRKKDEFIKKMSEIN